MRLSRKRALITVGLSVLAAAPQYSADIRHLTLTEAVHLALAQNCVLKIAWLKVLENEQKKTGEHSAYFPALTNQSNVLHISELQQIDIPAGAFGMELQFQRKGSRWAKARTRSCPAAPCSRSRSRN